MTVFCPDCLEPVDVSPNARDGRCDDCRPVRRRDVPRQRVMDSASSLQSYAHHHNRQQASQ